MAIIRRLAAPLGLFLVFVAMAAGMAQAADFVPAAQSVDPGTVKEPPNNTSNKTT